MLQTILKKGDDRRIKGGHPWIFSNEIQEVRGEKTAGGVTEVFDCGNRYLGTGFYNPGSLISVRLLSLQREDLDSEGFYRKRIEKALRMRRTTYPRAESFRVVYGESDFLPGLIVDKYGDYVVVQLLTQGMEARKHLVLPVLLDMLAPRAIIARNDAGVRKLEGLEQKVEVLHGDLTGFAEIEEHGLRFRLDLLGGQKTGHFLDQRENHLLLQNISKGKKVLDCFCYSGTWGIHAASFGAEDVTFVDSSEKALILARQNAAINGISASLRFDEADAFERLKTFGKEKTMFDVVVLDPPAFVKNKKMLKEAEKGYLTINRRAMELLTEGGYLITCSCSYHMGREMFRDMLAKAARLAGRQIRLVQACAQPPDHPVLLAVPETEYLKCFLLQAV